MKRSTCSEDQVAYALRQVETDNPVGDVCRQLGVSNLRRLRQLKDESWRLKHLVADLTLDKHMLPKPLRQESEVRAPSWTGPVVSGDITGHLRIVVSWDSFVREW